MTLVVPVIDIKSFNVIITIAYLISPESFSACFVGFLVHFKLWNDKTDTSDAYLLTSSSFSLWRGPFGPHYSHIKNEDMIL